MKIEFHCHSKEASPDAFLSIEELIPLHKEKGYDALVLTNHFNTALKMQFEQQGIKDYHRYYHDAIRKAAQFAEKYDFLVLGGYEIKFDCHKRNEFLVYGMTEEHCRDCEQIFAMTPAEFAAFAEEKGFLFYQAHPFRNGMEIINPSILFGIEVKNTHPRNDSRNDIAAAWAEKFKLRTVCGSDCHKVEDVGSSAIVTGRNITSMTDLVQMLRDNDYTIL